MRLEGAWMTRPETREVFAALAKAGHRAYFVGGCVRNALLSEPVADIDIATDAPPESVTEAVRSFGLKSVPTGIEHGTVTVISGGKPHEVTSFRADIETDGRHARVRFGQDITQDARRRDFTMNALYAAPDGLVVDPLNGLTDLRARRVRFIEDPVRRIREDYLRILRFFRFHAWYGDPERGLDPNGLAACAQERDGIGTLSRERIGAEMRKLLGAPDPAPALAAMQETGVLHSVLPGSDAAPMARLVLLEAETCSAPDALRRLAFLGGEDAAERLRLTRAEARRLDLLGKTAPDRISAGEIGYRHGSRDGADILLLRAAMRDTPLAPEDWRDLARGAEAVLPVKPTDFMPELTGPALGRHLRTLEARWIASGFTLRREDLL